MSCKNKPAFSGDDDGDLRGVDTNRRRFSSANAAGLTDGNGLAGLRLIVDPPATGAWNMAVDEYLLDAVAEGAPPTLRLYQWSAPTLSLGYFQRSTDRQLHTTSFSCEMVRRHSGGGAILHDQELTYSLALPLPDGQRISAEALYLRIHRAIIAALTPWATGFELSQSVSNSAFLCFQRRAIGDVLLDGHKVIGSAQRRKRGGLLQHGSVLLNRSPKAPELPGIADLIGNSLPSARIATAIAGEISTEWKMNLGSESPPDTLNGGLAWDAEQKIRCLVEDRFTNDQWNYRR